MKMPAAASTFRKLHAAASKRLTHVPSFEENIAIKEPHTILQQWLADALKHAPQSKPRVACLATVNRTGKPLTSLTTVEQISDAGVTFYTTLGRIESNAPVSLQFHWPMLTRSVRIAGRAHRLTDAQAMEQFRRYPQHVQKSICTGRRERHLGGVYKKISSCLRSLFAQEEKPQLMPTNWGGYLVEPIIYEFDEISGVSPCTDCLLFHRGSPKSIRNHTVNDSAWIFESVQKIH